MEVIDDTATRSDRSGLSDRQRLLARLSERLAADSTRKLCSVELRRSETGRSPTHGAMVGSWQEDDHPDLFNLKGANRFVGEIIAAAEENILSFETSRFIVCMYDRRQQTSTFVLYVDPNENSHSAVSSSAQELTSRALVQMMNQCERYSQTIIKLAAGACEQMKTAMDQFARHANELEKDRREWVIEREKLMSRHYQRETDRMIAESSIKRRDEGLKKLLGMGDEALKYFKPWLASKMGSPEVAKVAQVAEQKQAGGKALSPTELVAMLFSKVRPDQYERMLESMPEEKVSILMPIIERIPNESQDEPIRAFVRSLTLSEITAMRSILDDEQTKILGAIIASAEQKAS
jgi:hypothetical protein